MYALTLRFLIVNSCGVSLRSALKHGAGEEPLKRHEPFITPWARGQPPP